MEDKGPKSVGAGKSGGPAGVGSSKESITPNIPGVLLKGESNAAADTGVAAGFEGGSGSGKTGDDQTTKTPTADAKAREEENYYNGGNGGEEERDESSENEEDEENSLFKMKALPFATIVAVVTLFGFFIGMFMSPTFSLTEGLRNTFNTMQTSVRMRSMTMARYQLDNNFVKNPVRAKLFGANKFKFSNKQKELLKTNQIDVEDEDIGGKKMSVMKFDEGGKKKIIVADESLVAAVRSKYPDTEVQSFRQAFETDSWFFRVYSDSSTTWRGAVANWFGSAADNFLSTNKLTRNLWKSYKEDLEAADGDAKRATLDTIGERAGVIQEPEVVRTKVEGETDSNGNVTSKIDPAPEGAIRSRSTFKRAEMSLDSVSEKMTNIAKKMKGDVSGVVEFVVSSVCLVTDTVGAIALLVAASQAIQVINLAISFLEASDKARAGTDDGLINEMNNLLMEPSTNYHYDLDVPSDITKVDDGPLDIEDDAKVDATYSTIKNNAEKLGAANTAEKLDANATKTTKSAMQASAIQSLFSGGKIDPNDPSIQNLNAIGGAGLKVITGIGAGTVAFSICSGAKMLANMWGFSVDVVQTGGAIVQCIAGIVGSIGTGGISLAACGKMVGKIAIAMAISAVFSLAVTAVVTAVVPFFAKIMMKDVIAELGEDWGNAIYDGGGKYLPGMHRSTGGSLATAEKYTQFAAEKHETVAEVARYEQMTKSPFDASSQYTFLGKLVRQFSNFAGVNSVMSALTTTASTVSSSLISMMPTALAYDVADDLIENYDEVCPNLDSIGAVGDAFCNPYIVTDVDTINDDPMDVVDAVSNNLIIETVDGQTIGCESDTEDTCSISESIDSGIEIKGDSDLAKYIIACDQRSSDFGIIDQNISFELSDWANVKTPNSTVNSAANGTIGGAPAVGDFIDVINNGQKLANYGYIDGESCVAGNDMLEEGTKNSLNDALSVATPDWDEARYYQRFIEDQTLLETMGVIEESAVTAFLNDYYEQHPLDNSYEGILARYSGLEKEDVIALLDIMDYGTYIAEYDPSTRYAFGQEVKPEGAGELIFDNENKVAYVVLLNEIEFADVRNRNFVV